MRQSRIYTPQPLAETKQFELDGSAGHYLVRVLRLVVGNTVTLFNGDGRNYAAEICEIQGQNVLLKVIDSLVSDNESPLKITLVQAVSRGERMDYALQKATELGVFGIQPVMSKRVEVRLDEKRQVKRVAHWQSVVISACEQSGRAVVPQVNPPISLFDWAGIADNSARIVLDPASETRLTSVSIQGDEVSLIVGPEGGFDVSELTELKAQGVSAVSLGRRVLRTESAGPAAIAVLQAAIGDI